MKRFFAFLLAILVLSGCDDGELTQVSFEFDDASAKPCGTGSPDFFIYKTQDRRTLIVQLPETSFENEISVDQTTPPLQLAINGSNIRLIYREYSGEITDNTICSVVPPANPIVTQEREATSGKITITTTAILSEPNANGATQITNYLHTLVFTDLVFDLGDNTTQINEAITQVTFQTLATGFTNFSNLTGVKSCTNNGVNDATFLFKYQNDQALILDLSDSDAAFLFSNEPGPKKRYFSSETILTHAFFNTSTVFLNDAFFCSNPTPVTPPVIDSFTAEDGVTDISGIIEVTSLQSVNGFKHTIVLKKVRLVKGTLKRELGNEFIFGEFETSN